MILPIQGYSRQSFTSVPKKDFRLPVNGMTFSVSGSPIHTDKFKGWKVYYNPRAEEYYNNAQKAENMQKRLFWLEKLGFPDEIVSETTEKFRRNIRHYQFSK